LTIEDWRLLIEKSLLIVNPITSSIANQQSTIENRKLLHYSNCDLPAIGAFSRGGRGGVNRFISGGCRFENNSDARNA
jgi:hypothetical protein